MTQCADIKKLHKIQQAFAKGVNLETWEEAVEAYPRFATAEKLEPFKHLNFSKADIPPQFLNYCQYITGSDNADPCDISADDFFSFNNSGAIGIFWKNSVSNISVDTIDTIFATAQVKKFSGFTLAVLDYARSSDVDTNQVCVLHCIHI